MKKTAVITDATSPEFFFPLWKRYYGNMFGFENLYVVTYQGLKKQFIDAGVEHVWEVNKAYNDVIRAKVVSSFVDILLATYDVVLRSDVDEFLIPDKRDFNDLAEYVERNSLPYVTANGIDVMEMKDDPELSFDRPLLISQRKYGMRSAALNKTSLTTIPLVWSPGFHSASVSPKFSGLLNFHLKLADIKGRIRWHEHMSKSVLPDTREADYFVNGAEKLLGLQHWYDAQMRIQMYEVSSQSTFDSEFLNSVEFNPVNRIYQGAFISQKIVIELDAIFSEII